MSAETADEAAFMAALLADLDPTELFAPPSSPLSQLVAAAETKPPRASVSSSSRDTSGRARPAAGTPAAAATALTGKPGRSTPLSVKFEDDRKPSRSTPAATPARLPSSHSAFTIAPLPLPQPQPPPQQQQMFDDLLAGVNFDDFDDDDWAVGSSTFPPAPMTTTKRAVARPQVRPASCRLRPPLPPSKELTRLAVRIAPLPILFSPAPSDLPPARSPPGRCLPSARPSLDPHPPPPSPLPPPPPPLPRAGGPDPGSAPKSSAGRPSQARGAGPRSCLRSSVARPTSCARAARTHAQAR